MSLAALSSAQGHAVPSVLFRPLDRGDFFGGLLRVPLALELVLELFELALSHATTAAPAAPLTVSITVDPASVLLAPWSSTPIIRTTPTTINSALGRNDPPENGFSSLSSHEVTPPLLLLLDAAGAGTELEGCASVSPI
jgi:hypothetical protein